MRRKTLLTTALTLTFGAGLLATPRAGHSQTGDDSSSSCAMRCYMDSAGAPAEPGLRLAWFAGCMQGCSST